MGLYLPNMEMPREGQMLVIFPDGTSYVSFRAMRERLAQTEAVPVPPHGRLIDIEYLVNYVEDKYKSAKGAARKAYRDVLDMICAAPTIIEEEGER